MYMYVSVYAKIPRCTFVLVLELQNKYKVRRSVVISGSFLKILQKYRIFKISSSTNPYWLEQAGVSLRNWV